MFIFKSIRQQVWATAFAFAIIVTLIYLLLQTINHYFPYQPQQTETVQYVLAQKDRVQIQPHTGLPIRTTNIEIFEVISTLPKAQLVMKTFTTAIVDGDTVKETLYCFEVEYITKHLLDGLRAYSGFGGHCESAETQHLLSPIRMQGHHEKGSYALAGMITDEEISTIKAHWRDGTETETAVKNKAFLFFREDDVEVEWVIGLDNMGKPLTETQTFNRHITFTPLDYIDVQTVELKDGYIILGSFSHGGPQPQECLEATYATVENVEKFLRGKANISGQRACVLFTGAEKIAPTVSMSLSGQKITTGRVLEPDIKTLFVQWSDGTVESVPVLDGAFFAITSPTLATGTPLSIDEIWGVDQNGERFSW